VRISVGVPAYNQGQYLAETLDSLLSQTVPPDEIVVSDNHSTDETPDVLRRYEGQVRIIRPPGHLPMTAHWNFVVENLSGDWFSLLSSDDVAEPGFVQHLSRAARRDRNAVLVRGGCRAISPSGQPRGRGLLWSTSGVTEPPRTFLDQLEGPEAFFAAFLCCRSAWEQVGGFPPALRLYGDWGLWIRLSPVGTFVTTHRIVARYRTGYPDSRIVDRIVDAAHDERVVALELAVGVADTLGLSSQAELRRATEFRLIAYIAQAAALVVDAATRERVADELNPIAEMVGQGRILDDFRAGKLVQAPRRGLVRRGAAVVGARLRDITDQRSRSVG
jgi:glycosyltransferase involved in cell wall biosynthesis